MTGRMLRAAAVLGVAGLACGTALPPVTAAPTGEDHPGKWIWFDLLTEDAARAREFYGTLFGWTFEQVPGVDGYSLVHSGGVAIAGLAEVDGREPEHTESQWLSSLAVEDVDAAAAVVEANGGEVLLGPVSAGERGRLAAVRDPSGAALVLLRTDGRDPPDAAPPVGGWLWTDLWTEDGDSAKRFYAELVGYESRTLEVGREHRYEVLGRDGRARAGIVVVDLDGIEPNWLPYVRVGDVAKVAREARARGGAVVLERDDVAVLIDPTGAAIGVQRHDGGRGS